jgi:hypothetical protein
MSCEDENMNFFETNDYQIMDADIPLILIEYEKQNEKIKEEEKK